MQAHLELLGGLPRPRRNARRNEYGCLVQERLRRIGMHRQAFHRPQRLHFEEQVMSRMEIRAPLKTAGAWGCALRTLSCAKAGFPYGSSAQCAPKRERAPREGEAPLSRGALPGFSPPPAPASSLLGYFGINLQGYVAHRKRRQASPPPAPASTRIVERCKGL